MSLVGPGPNTGDANYHSISATQQLLLIDLDDGGASPCSSGVVDFLFRDPTDSVDTQTLSAASSLNVSDARLSLFAGATPSTQWTLVVEDTKRDGLVGSLEYWSVNFTLSPCQRAYTWDNLTSVPSVHVSAPTPRYHSRVIAYGSSLFVYGGIGPLDAPLYDLHRFDTTQLRWTMLSPAGFNQALDTYSAVGASYVLSSWGLLRFGGYTRQYFPSDAPAGYTNDVFVMNPVDLRWHFLDVSSAPTKSDFNSDTLPPARYYASTAFVPSRALSLHLNGNDTYRMLYDSFISSSRSNFAGTLVDSLLLFGGYDGSSGSTPDGSSGGMFSDMWMLRLNNLSTTTSRWTQTSYVRSVCHWRTSSSYSASEAGRCLGSSGSQCSFRDLLMLAWCSLNNQTLS